MKYRKSLVMNLIGKSVGGNVNSLTNVNVLLGFSEIQIEQVIKNCNELFSLDDVLEVVEIWNMHHTQKILTIISQVFGDISIGTEMQYTCDAVESDDDMDDILLEE